MGVEKLPSPEIRKNKIALGCPTNDVLDFLDILYPPNFARWEETGVFQQPQAIALIEVLSVIEI